MMILKCITIYLIIGWLYEGIHYVLMGGINKYWDEVIKEEDYDKRYSQELLNFAIIFSIIIIPFAWPACLGYSICYGIKKYKESNQK